MTMTRILTVAILTSGISVAPVLFADHHSECSKSKKWSSKSSTCEKNLVSVAAGSKDFKTLAEVYKLGG